MYNFIHKHPIAKELMEGEVGRVSREGDAGSLERWLFSSHQLPFPLLHGRQSSQDAP